MPFTHSLVVPVLPPPPTHTHPPPGEMALVASVLGTPAAQQQLVPALMRVYGEADFVVGLDVDRDVYDKFTVRTTTVVKTLNRTFRVVHLLGPGFEDEHLEVVFAVFLPPHLCGHEVWNMSTALCVSEGSFIHSCTAGCCCLPPAAADAAPDRPDLRGALEGRALQGMHPAAGSSVNSSSSSSSTRGRPGSSSSSRWYACLVCWLCVCCS